MNHPKHVRKEVHFDKMYQPSSSLGEQTRYLNLGFWTEAETTFDQGFERLIQEVTVPAQISATDRVLDVGCGLGDQDFYMMRRYGPRELTALNISAAQIEVCVSRRPSDVGNINFVVGDALNLPFVDASFDVVVAVECAHHFADKSRFFAEAFRVLRPGGRLVMADLLGQDEAYSIVDYLKLAVILPIFALLYGVPRRNFLEGPELEAQRLRACGFTRAEIRSVYDEVLKGFIARLKAHMRSEQFRQRAGAWFYFWGRLAAIVASALGVKNMPFDYVLVFAHKPK